MGFDVDLVITVLPAFLRGLAVTVGIWLAAGMAGAMLGFLVAVLRCYGPAPVAVLLAVLVEIVRGTPFLVQIFLLYFGGPFIGLYLEPVPAGLLGLAIYAAAYFSEIFRAGFKAVPRGHIEAAECVGFTRSQILRRITIPEMTMLVLPQCVNLAIVLIKETAILSIITVPEMTSVLSALGSQQYAFIEALFILALVYWLLVELCGWVGHASERRLSKFRFA